MKKIINILTIFFTLLIFTTTISLADDANFTLIDNVPVQIKAGETKDITFKLRNVGGDSARKTEVEFSVKNDEKNTLEFAEPVKYVGFIFKTSTANVTVKLTAGDLARIGKYPVDMIISSYNAEGGKGSITKRFDINVTEEKIAPRIKISSVQNSGLVAGEKSVFKFNVTNDGEVDLKNLKLELSNQDKSSLYIDGNTNVIYVEKLSKGETKTVSYNVIVSDSYSESTLSPDIKYSFKDTMGTEYTGNQSLFIALNDYINKKLDMDNVVIDKAEVVKNEEFNLSGVVKNTGDTNISDVDIAIELEDGIIPVSQSVYHENEIKLGEAKTYSFKIKAKDDAAEKNYNIKLKATYKKGTKEEIVYRYAGVYLKSKADSKKSVPKIIIGEYKISPNIVRADSEFDLDISFKNTHLTKSVKNIKAYITVDEKSNETGSVFSPVNASNTFYITDIAPGQSLKKQLRMYTIPDAKPKTYEIIINIEYEDEEGNALTGKEYIGIPVKQRTKVELSDVTSNGEKFVGKDVYMQVNVLNTGMTDVRNVKVSIEGDVEKRSPEQFFGAFTAGNSQFVELTISPTKVGPTSGEVVLTYEDLGGNVEKLTRQFSFDAMEEVVNTMGNGVIGKDGRPMPEGEQEVPKESKGFDWVLWGSIGGGLLFVIIVVVIIIIRRRRKKKKEIEMMLDE